MGMAMKWGLRLQTAHMTQYGTLCIN